MIFLYNLLIISIIKSNSIVQEYLELPSFLLLVPQTPFGKSKISPKNYIESTKTE